jgi:hypothetical protein
MNNLEYIIVGGKRKVITEIANLPERVAYSSS